MRALGALLVTLGTFVLLATVGIVLLTGWSIGLGWLLTRLLPVFTIFEASLLIMLASIAVAYVGSQVMTTPVPGTELAEELENLDSSPIPSERFFNSETDKTGEAVLRYRLANSIYLDLEDEPNVSRMMRREQLEELAVRLTGLAVGMLKRKNKQSGRIGLTVAALTREMEKKGQKPYDADIMRVAIDAINEQLFFDLDLIEIVRRKRWDEPMPDWFLS